MLGKKSKTQIPYLRTIKRSINFRYVAAKTYYFGVGGGMRQFETLVLEDKIFDVERVWKSDEGKLHCVLKYYNLLISLFILGLQREIIKLVKRKQ